MKFLYIWGVTLASAISCFGQASVGGARVTASPTGNSRGAIVTQTSTGVSAPGGVAVPVVTPVQAQASTVVGTTVGTSSIVTPSTGIQTGSLTPLTAVPTQTGGTLVVGTATAATPTTPATTTEAVVPAVQNSTDIFGRATGPVVNPAAVQAAAIANQAVANANVNQMGVGGGATTAAQGQRSSIRSVSAGQVVTAPGFTQVVLTLQGTVPSETDHQTILNRFQGLPGIVVVDQIQVVDQTTGQVINQAAGAGTITSGATTTSLQPSQTPTLFGTGNAMGITTQTPQ